MSYDSNVKCTILSKHEGREGEGGETKQGKRPCPQHLSCRLAPLSSNECQVLPSLSPLPSLIYSSLRLQHHYNAGIFQ